MSQDAEPKESVAVTWQWANYSDLTRDQLLAALALRQDVFIVEQNCPFHDIDGLDQQALHLLGWFDGRLIATLRLFPQFEEYNNRCSIGRICTHRDFRRFGVGRELVAEGLAYIDQHWPEQETEIGAQLYLERFYQSFGFQRSSDVYDEDGIDHIHMIRSAKGN